MRCGEDSSLELLRRARGNDASASQELLQRFRAPLLGRIRLMMGEGVRRVAESQDFLQEVMVDFLKTSQRFETKSEKDILRWMTAVARNNIRDVAQRKRVQAFASLSASFSADGLEGVTPSPSGEAVQHEGEVRLVEGLEALGDDYRQVIELHRLEGLTLKEVARRMGRSHAAVRQLHTRAVVKLGFLLSS